MMIGILSAILSGILLAFSYPIFNLEFLAFIAFIPLFFAIKKKNIKQTFIIFYIAGIVFWLITIYWLIHVTLAGWILLVLYLSLYFGFFGLFFKLNTQYSILNTLIVPAAWVFLEYLRSIVITGFPWAMLGYSQYLNLPIIQIADFTGVWGVSFIVMMVNVALFQLIARSPKPGAEQNEASPKGKTLGSIIAAIFLVLFVFAYGFCKLYFVPRPSSFVPLKISVIQGSVPQDQKWDQAFRNSILERYELLTKEAAKDKPDLIIWPETSVPDVIGEDPAFLDRMLKLAKTIKTPLLLGAVTTRTATSDSYSFEPGKEKKRLLPINRYYNSAVLISKEGIESGQYDKIHLVPFGEYVPLEAHLPFLRGMIGIPIGDFTAGNKYTVFNLETLKGRARFSALICFEDIMPFLTRRFVKDGADFLVNMTNDAWFMESSAPYQHAQASVFRAIENRVPVVRAANTGLSCFIDRYGRIYDKVNVGNKDIFVAGYKTDEIK